MVELPRDRLPLDEREVLSVVFRVTTNTLGRARILADERRVQSPAAKDPCRDVLVALHAAKVGGACAHPVTGGASRWPVERPVRSGERSGRDLGVHIRDCHHGSEPDDAS